MTGDPPSMGNIRDWMRKVESDLERLDDKWQRSVDDIKNTIKGQISDLKQDQIAEFKRRLDQGYMDMRTFEQRIQQVELEQTKWQTSAGVVNWLIKFAFLLVGAIAALIGIEAFKH